MWEENFYTISKTISHYPYLLLVLISPSFPFLKYEKENILHFFCKYRIKFHNIWARIFFTISNQLLHASSSQYFSFSSLSFCPLYLCVCVYIYIYIYIQHIYINLYVYMWVCTDICVHHMYIFHLAWGTAATWFTSTHTLFSFFSEFSILNF
jgi:hypothetical protein